MTLEDLKKDEALTAKVLAGADFDEVVRSLRENGVEFDEDALRAAYAGGDEELSESALENVAGGSKGNGLISWLIEQIKDRCGFHPPKPRTPVPTPFKSNKKKK